MTDPFEAAERINRLYDEKVLHEERLLERMAEELSPAVHLHYDEEGGTLHVRRDGETTRHTPVPERYRVVQSILAVVPALHALLAQPARYRADFVRHLEYALASLPEPLLQQALELARTDYTEDDWRRFAREVEPLQQALATEANQLQKEALDPWFAPDTLVCITGDGPAREGALVNPAEPDPWLALARVKLEQQRDPDHPFLQRAVQIAVETGTFGAVVVKDGKIVAEGANRVTAEHDPTWHAEMAALRNAGQALKSNDLAGCTIYASHQPCPMCDAAIRWANVDRVVYHHPFTGTRPLLDRPLPVSRK